MTDFIPIAPENPTERELENPPKLKIEELQAYYSSLIRSFYSKRDDNKYLDLAIRACEKQISIAKKLAEKESKGEKRFILKSDEETMDEFRKASARDLQIIQDNRNGELKPEEYYNSIKSVDSNEKYAGMKLPKGFNPNIHKSPDAFEIIPGKLGVHPGYQQLCIIREKQGNHEEVIRLAEQAKTEGWAGDWDSRIAKARKKLGGGA